MAAVKVTLTGVIIDLYGRTITGPVKFVGEMVRSDVSVGGGPIMPPEGGGGPPDGGNGKPPGIWPGPGDPDFPGGPHPSHPIALPGDPWWPGNAPQPPQLPPPGSPPVIVPGTTPTHPINPPAAIVVDYPGIGKVLVPQPLPSGSAPPQS